jgi:cytochrome P450
MLKMLKDTLMERLNDPSKRRGDFLDQAIDDMKTKKFLTVDFIPQLMFGILFASFESMSTTLTLTFKFLTENPRVVEELRVRIHTLIASNFKLSI